MMNKRILVLFLAIFGLNGACSFGMNPPGPMQSFPLENKEGFLRGDARDQRTVLNTQSRLLKEIVFLSKELGISIPEASLQGVSDEDLNRSVNELRGYAKKIEEQNKHKQNKIEQLNELLNQLGKKSQNLNLILKSPEQLDQLIEQAQQEIAEKKEAEKREAFHKKFGNGYRVVRGFTIALTAAWRIRHYATKVCAVLGRNDLENSTAMNLGSLAAAGTLAFLDYFIPGKVGSFFVGALSMDFLNSKILASPALPVFTSPRIG